MSIDPSGGGRDVAGVVGGFLGDDGRVWVTDDVSAPMSSAEWSTAACRLAHRTNAAIIYVEWNFGRDMCVLAIQTSWEKLQNDGEILKNVLMPELTCPSCGAALAPWGHGQPREVRGDLGSRLFVRPRRSRCTGCQVTHVLLPEMLWPRRMDAAEVIGAGLEIAALGMGHRQVAARLGLAEDTVRGWFRRFRRRSEDVRRYFTVALVALADDPVMPEPAGTPLSDAVSVIAAAHRAAAMRWPEMNTVSRWAFAGRVIDGRVLSCTPSAS